MKAERDNPHPAVRPPQRGIRDIDHGRSGTRQPIGTTSTTAASTKVSKPISQAFVCVSIARTPGRNANRPLSVPSGRTPKGFQALCRVASPCVALRGSRLVFAWALAGARNRLARSENRLTHPTPANQAAGLTYPPTTPRRPAENEAEHFICARGLSANSFAVLRQGTLRRGNSCLDVGIARCDGAVRAQMEGDTLEEEGSLLSRQQGVRPCHL